MSKTIKILPGDTLVVRLPELQPNKKITCSARVLDREASKPGCFVGQIIDVVMFSSRDKRFAPGSIVEIPEKDVLSASSAEIDGHRSTLMVEVSNGVVVGLSRVDGQTEQINVLVVDRDTGSETVFGVDSFSAETKASNESEIDGELFDEQNN